MAIRDFIRSQLQKLGYDIVKFKPAFVRNRLDGVALSQEFAWLKAYDFGTIIDIGANEGQFADKMRGLFPDADIYAFEPLPIVFQKLSQNFSGDNRFFPVNMGIGDRRAQLSMRENEYSPSSSFLTLADPHKANFEDAIQTREVSVDVDTLDNFFAGKILKTPILLKMDVQGFEDKVILGGEKTLSHARMVISELSFVELYQGQPLFEKIYSMLFALGFAFCGSIEQLRSPQSRQILQADGVFIKG